MKEWITLLLTFFAVALLSAQSAVSGSDMLTKIIYDQDSRKFELQNPPPLKAFPKQSEPPYWGIYFWEFGDGHYSTEQSPVHAYREGGDYRPVVYLTPFKALNKPVRFSYNGALMVKGGTSSTPDYGLEGKRVHIVTNAQDNVIPEHPIRFALHYCAPSDINSNTGGYLFFFFNNPEELDVGFDPFVYQPDETSTYYQEKVLADPDLTVETKLSGPAQWTARRLLNNYTGLIAFRIEEALRPGQERRLFFTLLAEKRLERFRSTLKELTFEALWVPDKGDFNKEIDLSKLTMDILPVHDPNRIRVSPRFAYYRKGYPKELRYRIDFQNEEEGIVKDVEIQFPVGEGMRMIDPYQVRGFVKKTDPPCPDCPPVVPDDLSCFKVEHRGNTLHDSLVFIFKNIGLEGKKSKGFFESRKSTKGRVDFVLTSSSYASTPRTRTRAFIEFLGTGEERTRTARVAWRHRSLGLRLGMNFAQQGEDFESLSSNLLDRLSIGLRFEDAALGLGPVFALEIGYSPFQMEKITTDPVEPNAVLPAGGFLIQRQHINVKFVEIKALSGYQLNPYVRFQGGLGVQMPAFSDITFEADAYTEDMNDPPVISDRQTIHSGLFDKRSSIYLFDNWFPPRTQAGVTFHLGVEAGLMNDVVLGVNNESRLYRHYYEHHCLFLNNWQVYVRFKLLPIGMKR